MFSKADYVYAVYQEGSFTKAAEKLYLAQPSLSAAIKSVEESIGAPLFERSGAGVRLTEIGKEYIAAAEKVFLIREEFNNKIRDIYGLESGKIVVGGTNYLSSYVLPKIINRFSYRYPKVEVVLEESKSQTLHEMLKAEKIDVLVDSFEAKMQEYTTSPLAKEKILLCVPKSFTINEGLKKYAIYPQDVFNNPTALDAPPVPIEAFKNENFVLLKSGNDMYYRAQSLFEKAGITPKICFSVDQMNISYALAESGIGICFATDTLFRFGRFSDSVVLYNVELSGRTLYVAHKKNKYCTHAMKKFIEIAQEVMQDAHS